MAQTKRSHRPHIRTAHAHATGSSRPPDSPADVAKPRWTPVQRVTLAVVCVATAMLMLDIAVVNTALPAMAREFDAGMTSLKWVIDGYTPVSYTHLTLPTKRIV